MTKFTKFVGVLSVTTFVAGFSLGLGLITGLIAGAVVNPVAETTDTEENEKS